LQQSAKPSNTWTTTCTYLLQTYFWTENNGFCDTSSPTRSQAILFQSGFFSQGGIVRSSNQLLPSSLDHTILLGGNFSGNLSLFRLPTLHENLPQVSTALMQVNSSSHPPLFPLSLTRSFLLRTLCSVPSENTLSIFNQLISTSANSSSQVDQAQE
jgi:hypothetical protein